MKFVASGLDGPPRGWGRFRKRWTAS